MANLHFSANRFAAVTPHDSNTVPIFPNKGFFIGVGGDIVIQNEFGDEETFAVSSGTILPVKGKVVLATGTNASNIIVLDYGDAY